MMNDPRLVPLQPDANAAVTVKYDGDAPRCPQGCSGHLKPLVEPAIRAKEATDGELLIMLLWCRSCQTAYRLETPTQAAGPRLVK